MDETEPPAAATELAKPHGTPWHLWAVGGISLLWNCFGALQYTMAQLRNETYLASAAKGMGITAADLIGYIDSFPVWLHVFWALGVWGAVAGSLLLLTRSRHAVSVFAASLLGLAVTQFHRMLTPQPEWAGDDIMLNLILWSMATFLLIYAISMRGKAVLR